MSAFREKCRTFYGVNNYLTDALAVLNRLSQRACRGMNAAADVAYIVDGPALAFADHQHFILPGLGALGQLHAQRDIARIGVWDGGSTRDLGAVGQRCAAGERVRLKQRVMLRIAGRIIQQFGQTVAQIRTKGSKIVTAMLNTIIIELLRHGIRATVNAGAAAGTDILKGWRDRGGARAEHQRARH